MCRCGVTFRDSLPQTAGGWTDVALMRTPYPYSSALLTFPLFPQWDSALVWHGAERTHGAPLRHCCCQERGEIKGGRRRKITAPRRFCLVDERLKRSLFLKLRFPLRGSPGTLFWHVYALAVASIDTDIHFLIVQKDVAEPGHPLRHPLTPKKLLTLVIKHIWPRFCSLLDPSASVMSHFLVLNASLGLRRKYMWKCKLVIVFPLNICGVSIGVKVHGGWPCISATTEHRSINPLSR